MTSLACRHTRFTAPVGVGALVGPGVELVSPLAYGGTQEGALRPGTENLPGIAGLGVALELRASRFERVVAHTLELRTFFESELGTAGVIDEVNGSRAERLTNTSNVRFARIDGEALVVRLDQVGVRCSQSSACTNHKPEPSYVLRAMGLSETEAFASVRFGFSELNNLDEVRAAAESIGQIHASLERFAVA